MANLMPRYQYSHPLPKRSDLVKLLKQNEQALFQLDNKQSIKYQIEIGVLHCKQKNKTKKQKQK